MGGSSPKLNFNENNEKMVNPMLEVLNLKKQKKKGIVIVDFY
jgi:hypothetical protein